MKKLLIALAFCTTSLFAQLSQNVQQYVSIGDPIVVFENAILYDGNGGDAQENVTVVIENGKITKIGESKKVKKPKEAKVIDMTGKTLLPGFVMMHEHLMYPTLPDDFYHVSEMLSSFPKLYLAGGVTTMRTAGGPEPLGEYNLGKRIDNGQMVGPKIYVTSQHINRPSPYPIYIFDEINSPEEGEKIVDYWGDKGIESYKLYMNVYQEDMKAIVDRAHAKGFKVTGHICSVTYREAADLGIDNLEHGFMASSDFHIGKERNKCNGRAQSKALRELDKDDPKMEALMKHLIQKNVTITSTLPVFEPYTGREIFPGGANKAVEPQLREKIMNIWANWQNNDADAAAMFEKEMYWEKKFFDMGGKLTTGTDPTGIGRVVAGYANQHNLELLVEAKFTIGQAVQIQTKNGAEYLGVLDKKGTIEVGKNADLVMIDGDLREDIQNIRKMTHVFKDGIGFDSQKLFESAEGQVGVH